MKFGSLDRGDEGKDNTVCLVEISALLLVRDDFFLWKAPFDRVWTECRLSDAIADCWCHGFVQK